jgi:tRNA(Ile)-lysidine synthetase-like protein
MITILGKIPNKVTLAMSGGVDSMAVYHFLSIKGKRKVNPVFIDHKSEYCSEARNFLIKYFNDIGRELTIIDMPQNKPAKQSQEQYWRNERYRLLAPFECVLTAHHLDDVAETWIFSSLNGTPKIIPYRRNNVIRPFLATEKSDFINWCTKYKVPWFEDLSNQDIKYNRNRIRHKIMPEVLFVNPGFKNMLRKRVIEKFNMVEADT